MSQFSYMLMDNFGMKWFVPNSKIIWNDVPEFFLLLNLNYNSAEWSHKQFSLMGFAMDVHIQAKNLVHWNDTIYRGTI